MTPLAPPISDRDARAVLERNRAALARVQPELAVADLPHDLHPCPGRDGSPTFRLIPSDGAAAAWWRECSVPLAASRAMLDTFTPTTSVSLFLQPMHPAAAAHALSLLGSGQALVALLDAPESLAPFLACHDFSAAIDAHRLFFADGTDALATLLRTRPGLPTPGLFVRTNHLPDELVQSLVAACQKVFAAEHDRRAARVESLRASASPCSRPARRLVVSASLGFTLWSDAAGALSRVAAELPGVTPLPWATDDPLAASAVHLLELASSADAILAADFYRDGAQGLLPLDLPVLTWVTLPHVTSFSVAGPRDRLLLAHADFAATARAAGWPDARVTLATPPVPTLAAAPAPRLAFIADTRPIRVPAQVEEFSSHRLLWERAEAELTANPLRVGTDILAYLERLRAEMDIAADSFPAELIARELAVPKWQHEIARLCLRAGLPLALHGHGWDQLPDLAPSHQGPITTAAGLTAALTAATAILLPDPVSRSHPAVHAGRPVVIPSGDPGTFIRSVGAATLRPAAPAAATQALSPGLLSRLLA